ncbi:hypothetical protein [Streptomyces sp. NPDC054829]
MSTFTPREVAYDRYRAAVNSSRSVLGRHADDVRTDRARLLHRAAHSIAAALDGPARVHLPEPDDNALHTMAGHVRALLAELGETAAATTAVVQPETTTIGPRTWTATDTGTRPRPESRA